MVNSTSPSGTGPAQSEPGGSDSNAADPGVDSPPIYRGLTEARGVLADRPLWLNSLGTIALTGAAVGLRRCIDVFGAGLPPFALFYPVVLLCTLLGGVRSGVLSLVIAGVAGVYLWFEPAGFTAMSGQQIFGFGLFVFSNLVTILVTERLRKTLVRLRESEARLSLSQEVGRIGIWDMDLRTGTLWWSPSFRQVTGISADQPPSIKAFLARIDDADRPRAVEAFEKARLGHDRLDIDFRFHRDDGATIWLAGRAELFRDAQGNPARLLGINFDATPIRTAESQRDQANSLLQSFFENLPGAAFAKDLDGRYLLGNPVFASAIGHAEESFIGRDDSELLDPEQARMIMDNDRAVLAAGEIRQLEEALRLPNGEMSYWLAVKAPFRGGDGKPLGLMGISFDVTERRNAEERLRFLADEVDHRAKNLLGVVLSLVRLTKVGDVAAFKNAVSGRIEALARAHTLLAANRWQGANIATVIHEELKPLSRVGAERILVSGPSLMLEPNAAQALAMAVHELAINAAMYGALSADEGRLTVAWDMSESEAGTFIALHWTESGGPEVRPPAETGFGWTAIRGAIEHQLNGKFEPDWAPTGLTCRIIFPASRNIAAPSSPAAPSQAEGALVYGDVVSAPDIDLAGRRILVVEDEALIAITLTEILRDLGCTVIGPANSTAAALQLLEQAAPDLAILDVNLAGASSAPIARALRVRGVPFVYCTGYAEPQQQIAPDVIAPTLTKPIDPRDLAGALRGALGGADAPVLRQTPIEG